MTAVPPSPATRPVPPAQAAPRDEAPPATLPLLSTQSDIAPAGVKKGAAGKPPGPPLRIGVSARILHPDGARHLGFRNKTLQYLEASVAHWIMAHGALVFMVPTLESKGGVARSMVSIRDYVDALDGLVLQGGADVSPTTYNEEARNPAWQGDRVRDMYEIELLWAFVFQQKPVLGICRGMQLVNVAFNGSLYQDIPTEIPNAGMHLDTTKYDELHHRIDFEPGGLLERLYGENAQLRVNSIHHQCVNRLGNGLKVEARSPEDGIVEAIRWTGSSFVVGLQWHPEFHPRSEEKLLDSGPVINEFLEHSRRRKRDTMAAHPVAAKTVG